jgi:porin
MRKFYPLIILLVFTFTGQCYGEAATADPNAPAQDSADEKKGVLPIPDYTGDIWTRSFFTGDWGGERTELANRGIMFDFRLSQYYQNVTRGGRNTNGNYGGTMDYRLHLDGGRLGLWEGFFVDMHARTRFGRDVTPDAGALALENTGMLMPAPGDYQQTDITGLTANQFLPLGDNHIGLLTAGKLDILDAVTLFFPSVGYGQEGFMNVQSMVTALPWFGAVQGLSLYGGWLAAINKEYQIGQSAVLVTGTKSVSTSWGSLSDSFEEGAWIAGFHRFIWGDPEDKIGYFMVFAGGSTRDQPSNEARDITFVPGQGIESTESHKPWDVAVYLYQDFWTAADNPNRKANFMVGGTAGPDDPQFAQYNIFGNVEGYGLLESRLHDRMGVAGWYNVLSDNYKDLVSPVVNVRDTWGSELYYNAEITPALHVTPNIQLVQNAQDDDDMAVILGVRAVMDF